ncbi:hypothetical protein [Alicyclobacillus dauci]|uniref:Spore germination protein gerPA/gerPF n=1 Tax=Alicyclobacillus dauci TaxID=1475485 RepID=A0ABY6Z314_9BACL|nr:hypothetical protein [Alicyclobacillus dauci]WAH37231.1 hypothetical protein NZD86_01390 [Alicyclobacillus dauci]
MCSYFSPSFVIGSIRIGTVTSASALNIGNNWPTNFESHTKHNQGFGNIHGTNHQIRGAQSVLNDPDVFDMMNVSSAADIPDWLKALMKPKAEQPSRQDG